jgi:CDP-ribitol ribitolphosphotransferase
MDASYPYDRIDFELLYETLGEDAAALFRMHPWVREPVPIPEHMRDRMADAGNVPDINDLFYVTDVLWPDFSKADMKKALDYFETIQINKGK